MNARVEGAIKYSIENYGEGSCVTLDEYLMAKEILRLRGNPTQYTERTGPRPPTGNPSVPPAAPSVDTGEVA